LPRLIFGPFDDRSTGGLIGPESDEGRDACRRPPSFLFSRYCFLHILSFNIKSSPADRGDILQEIIAIVNGVARDLPGDRNPLDDGMPGG
jgi:hypothetical protein